MSFSEIAGQPGVLLVLAVLIFKISNLEKQVKVMHGRLHDFEALRDAVQNQNVEIARLQLRCEKLHP